MKVVLDLHDFSITRNRLLWLLSLKQTFPDFKVSLFTVPVERKEDWGPYLIRDQYLEELKRCLDWIKIIPHGLKHEGREMARVKQDQFRNGILPEIDRVFKRDGLPYEKGFCAPHWKWNQDIVDVLNEQGWWGAVDRDMKMIYPKTYYKYNYLLNEPFWEADGLLKIHGHIYGTKNDLGLCFDNLLKLPRDTRWYFVTDFLENENS